MRHESFRDPALLELLRAHDVALVVADSAGTWPYFEEDTAGFGYVRLHGADELYASGYTDEALDAWAAKVRGWRADGQDVVRLLRQRRQGARPAGRDRAARPAERR